MFSYIVVPLLILFMGMMYWIDNLIYKHYKLLYKNKTQIIKQGGYKKNKKSKYRNAEFELCKIIQPNYINASALLKSNYYVFNITDARIITFPVIRTYYLRTKNGLNCFEAICPSFDNLDCFKDLNSSVKEKTFETEKSKEYYNNLKKNWGMPIILDIIKYHGRDVKTENFDQRLKYINKLCDETHLNSPVYIMFDHTKQFGEQFSNILNTKKKTKMMMFKAPNKRYFHPHESYKWISPHLLEMIGFIKKNGVEFRNQKGYNEFLIDNEIPLTDLIQTILKKHKSGKVRIYMKNNEPAIEAIDFKSTKNLKITPLNEAKKIWKQMNKGMTIEGFLGNTLSIMKKINRNAISDKLFQHIRPKHSILDLGAGRGADVMMWKRKNLDVYAVEPDRINYSKLIKKRSIYPIHTLNAKGQENQKIIEFVPKTGVDYIIMIYSLTFFFEDDKTLDDLVFLISTLLKPGGLFIGTVMDGNKLLSWAKKSGKKKSGFTEIDCDPFTIKIYNKHKVFINIDDPVSLVHNQLEYLVNFDLFKKKLKKVGINLLETNFLDKEAEILNKCPRWFTSINRYFIFEKQIDNHQGS